MGTILQERVAQHDERVSTRDREWKKKASWSNNNRPNATSNKMGRRQSQRKTLQPQNTFPSQDSVHTAEKRLHQRRKHKPNVPLAKCNTSLLSAQGTSDSKLHPVSPAGDRKEPKVQQAAQCCHNREQKHPGVRGRRHTPAFPHRRLSESNPDLLESQTSNGDSVNLSGHGETDSDSDLSESERLPMPTSARVPPQLDLRPEVINHEDFPSHSHRGQGHGSFHFPDFLPPPFNSWSLSQLAVFYNMEGRGVPRLGPVGPLERYLERLLQLEWHQIQTVQEESGKSTVSDVLASCHRSSATVSSRLSSPKSILQCQRAFPLTFFSSLASHSALLPGCACTLCCLRYSTCSMTCCRSTHGHSRQSRLSPLPEHRGPVSLPKRSYSETRVHSDKSLASRAQRFHSPVRGTSHLRRMQALGNIRNPVQGATTTSHSTARDSSVGARRDCLEVGGVRSGDYRSAGLRKRSGSEQRRGGVERRLDGSEKIRSGSECRRGGAERRRAAEFDEREIKPDAVTAIMDNLPASKHTPIGKPNRPKQVEFVT